MRTSVNLVDAIIRLGAKPKNIFVLGKYYSECSSVVKQIIDFGVHYQSCSLQIGLGTFSQSFIRDINWLWFNVISHLKEDVEEVLVLDHGGYALSFIPVQIVQRYKVIGVEKTTAGLINLDTQGLPPFPLISVANCATKKILESPLIADAVINKLLPLIPIQDANIICGVVGYGAIGKAVVNKLLSMGHKVIVYDSDPHQLKNAKVEKGMAETNELSALVASSNYIFGCTGRDITTSIDPFRLSSKDKILISCSSEDREFLTFLKIIQKKRDRKIDTKSFIDVEYDTDMGATIRVLRGGLPINFDNSGESVPAKDIQLTRALVLGSILQAIQFFKKPDILNMGGVYALDTSLQYFIVHEWLKYQLPSRFPNNIIDNFQQEKWITEHSGGIHEPCDVFSDTFNKSPNLSK